jgi:uncharacterized protein YjlB
VRIHLLLPPPDGRRRESFTASFDYRIVGTYPIARPQDARTKSLHARRARVNL